MILLSFQEIFSFYVQQIVIDESNMILDSEPDTEKDILESTTYETKSKFSFVDDSKDPQSYVDRYNNESTYKEWFDENYPDYTIEEAVGVTQPIPAWIKNTANWWSEGMISEDEFIKGIEFLVEKRILNVN